ncbi:hypothetical protein DSLASN_03500 [Desulfoluna limicola]|uniref:Uncharacterized protein n=1 Tax=Desulfoluna limicola TaxID=2810562 RepID=A0ABN6EWJ1_9BACT|nr:hypothetical protein DSLASN_03500 [Desulfoluna limicola]
MGNPIGKNYRYSAAPHNSRHTSVNPTESGVGILTSLVLFAHAPPHKAETTHPPSPL